MLTTKIFNYFQILILFFLIQNGAYAFTASDEEEIIDIFMKYNYKKIIVKRPLKSEKKYSNINYQVKGKTTRFDIYI